MHDHDLLAAFQFNLLTRLGLREEDYLLDIGCGGLRAGRLFITYLMPGRYCGIEPRRDAVENGIEVEIGRELVAMKQPRFRFTDDLDLSAFDQSFDFLIANSVFSHAPPAAIRTGLTQAAKVMKPDALFLASFMRGSRDYEGEHWIFDDQLDAGAPGRINSLSTYTRPFLEDLCSDCGLMVDFIDGIHPGGQTWMFLRKEFSGSTRDIVNAQLRRTYVTAPLIPDWPSRPTHITPAVW